MAEVHKLPSLSQARREASEWIALLDSDDVTHEDRAKFNQWRSANAINARAFDDLSATYQEFVAAGPFVRAVSFAQSINEAVSPPKPWRAYAAGVIVALVGLVCGLAYWSHSAQPSTYRTALGEHATIMLPDGSTLELNSASSAEVEYEPTRRVVRLTSGEGYFEVSHDARRPFWVVAGSSAIRAVGTAFDVYLREKAVEVIVREGVVKVALSRSWRGTLDPDDTAGGPASFVKAGEQAKLQGASTATRPLSSAEMARAVAWLGGTAYFENQPLSEVTAELERYSTVHFVLGDDTVRQLRVGGTFQASPQGAETLITMLQRGFGLKVSREADRVYIQSRSVPPRT